MKRLMVLAVMAMVLSSLVRAEETKGSFSVTTGIVDTKSNFFEGQNGKEFAFGFRLSLNPWHKKGGRLNRLSVEPSLLFASVHSETTSDGAFKLRERLYQPGVDLGFKALNTERFDIIAYGGTSFSRDSFSVAQRQYRQWVGVCRYLEEGTCRSNWNIFGRGGARFLYRPKKDSKFFIGFDFNTRKQGIFVIGSEF